MKKILFSLMLMATILVVKAQAPQAFKYQTVVRDAGGNPITNQKVNFRISILQVSATGDSVYVETKVDTTNNFGLANLEIGKGNVVSGNFTAINWGNDNYFIRIQVDVTGGNNFIFMGTSQLLSVPYALYAEKSGATESIAGLNKQIIFNDSGKAGASSGLIFDKTKKQLAIGTSTPENSAALEINSTKGALLLPRMTAAQRDSLTPVNGMIIYNTTTNKIQGRALGNVAYGNTSVNTGYGNTLGEDNGHHIFNPPNNATITSIKIWVSASQTAKAVTLSVYDDVNTACGGSPTNLGTSNSVTVVPGTWNIFTFSTPVPVTVGNKYHIWSNWMLGIDGANNNASNTITDWYEADSMDCFDNSYDRPVEIITTDYTWVDLHY
ncbi:MAG: hypothetical protein PHD97_06330 [Bacteroidales bacterium]|nr:hypothetical protein [Bacteroidales bacterium]